MNETNSWRAESTEIFFPKYLEGYRERVMTYYEGEKHSFKLLEPVKLVAIHFIYDSFFIFSHSEEDQVVNVFATDEQKKEMSNLRDAPTHVLHEFIRSLSGLSDYVYESHLSEIAPSATVAFNPRNRERLPDWSKEAGKEYADQIYNIIGLQNALIQEQKSAAFPLFDHNELIELINDKGFTYEFTEAVQAYNLGLYLASTAIAAVALENLLGIAITRKVSKNSLPKDKYILTYATVLKRRNVIDERLHERITMANQLRRISAHSKTGVMMQMDAESLISCIKIVGESIFKNKA